VADVRLDTLAIAALGEAPWGRTRVRAAQRPPAAARLAIVGGGITGLSAALFAARAGVEVVVVDSVIGGGATARSGGIVLGDTLVGPAPEFDGCEASLRDWIRTEHADCDLQWTGCLELTRSDGGAAPPMGWYDGAELRVADAVPGGLVHPIKLLDALVDCSLRAGVQIAEGYRVAAIDRARDGTVLLGEQLRLAAEQVIFATDAISWPTSGDPWPNRTITVALQTEASAELGARVTQPFYTRELPLLWGRPMTDGSLLFGRELIDWPATASPDRLGTQVAAAADRLVRRVRGLTPALAEVRIHRVWAGPTARTAAGVPCLVQDPGSNAVIWAGGYGGHGLAQAFRLGQAAAAWAVQGDEPIRMHEATRAAQISDRRGSGRPA
jgi:glycine/D-amino acid oxidase-like deaminating enzyme